MTNRYLKFIKDNFEYIKIPGYEHFYLFKHAGQVWSFAADYRISYLNKEYGNVLTKGNRVSGGVEGWDLNKAEATITHSRCKLFASEWLVLSDLQALKEIIGFSGYKVDKFGIEFNVYK